MISTIASLIVSTSLSPGNIQTIDINATTSTTTSNYIYTTIDLSENRSVSQENDTVTPVFPTYIRNTSIVFCTIIMCLGVIGNVMVPIVIFKSKDMRNSTNIFLVNLSVADLMVLLVCTPTVLVEVNSKPETWVLGQEMCKAVPFVEMTVAHASVLTILAISFERYYAICKPLKAGYVCTKARASLICLLAWFFAAVFTSPILMIAEYRHVDYFDGTSVPACHTLANSFWSALYFLMTIFLFFIIPLILLLVIYAIIAKNLISDASKIVLNKHIDNYSIRARKQVVLMLGSVVLSFFLCLIPFRIFILWIIIVPDETVNRLGVEKYYNILYFCRIMVYLNSAINPILYNLMSSKFREGFLLCSKNRKFYFRRSRNGTLSTTVTSYRSSTFRSQGSFRARQQSLVLKNCSNNDSPDSNRSGDSRIKILNVRSRMDSIEIQDLNAIAENSSTTTTTAAAASGNVTENFRFPDDEMKDLNIKILQMKYSKYKVKGSKQSVQNGFDAIESVCFRNNDSQENLCFVRKNIISETETVV